MAVAMMISSLASTTSYAASVDAWIQTVCSRRT